MSIKIAETNCGRVEGSRQSGFTVFKGIPYAKPPVGSLRWCAPQPVNHWEGIYQAMKFPCKSMQQEDVIPKGEETPFYVKEFHDDAGFEVESSEDSLYLNIWTPADTKEDRLPVAFWIHGGAFEGGYGSEKEFDGESFCKRGVILVTINYRVNVFGFLAHPWLNEENPLHVSGNYGTLDQIAALKWVYENIHAFGGDKEKITVMGQSAGAMSVQTLVSSPLTENMIHKAIMQSGGGYDNGLSTDMPLDEAMEYGRQFVELTGAKSLEELRNKTPEELFCAYNQLKEKLVVNEIQLLMKPNVDGYVLPKGYQELADNGSVKKIPYLLGANKHDIFISLEEEKAGVHGRLYQGCVQWSHKLEENGGAPSYVYFFSRRLPGDSAGAFHSAELWYVFGTLGRCWRPMTEDDYRLSEEMLDYWTNFIKTGDPNGDGLEEWKPCTKGAPIVKNLDI